MKSREYLARGIPYISELYTDVVPEGWEHLIKIPYDDSPVDMKLVVDYYNKYLSGNAEKENISKGIREFAAKKIDMNATMQGIIAEYAR